MESGDAQLYSDVCSENEEQESDEAFDSEDEQIAKTDFDTEFTGSVNTNAATIDDSDINLISLHGLKYLWRDYFLDLWQVWVIYDEVSSFFLSSDTQHSQKGNCVNWVKGLNSHQPSLLQ